MHPLEFDELAHSRYVLLRSYRRDGTAVDTPVWFAVDGRTLLFRTKVGPKTRRLKTCHDVQLVPCDYRGRAHPSAPKLAGRATILVGAEAERANDILRKRYGWQWNIVPLISVPGVTNVHQDLCIGEKLRRARYRGVWPDSVIVRVDLP
ncbi:PPOX class F420-dependent oxidoreductase [Mycobacterium kubicae]|uniref:PPOX class F420-dependent oxidoreductase n=1 Tax=Mycobacterium kubicae TaxID=120959 RepID=UPI0016408B24|nr:PPOX class F420-dependent oxidoreductase [Mycobacterium kubicae]QNI06798.1 PPOX class F420-dependent oxidoreductase [Mycobacterium kubicae]